MATLLVLSAGLTACGGSKKKPVEPTADNGAGGSTEDAGAPTTASDADGGAPEKKDECVGFEIGDLDTVLGKSACEETGVAPGSVTAVDLKGKVDIVVASSPSKLATGGKADLIVSFTNKTKGPITLHFRIDPLARFEIEVYDKKNKRADLPKGKEPPPPAGATQPPPSDQKTAKVTIAANGSARTKLVWDAQKQKWAPEKYKGTPPERGYPRKADGPLPKGKYTVKVITPLVGISDQEQAQPKVDVEIGG